MSYKTATPNITWGGLAATTRMAPTKRKPKKKKKKVKRKVKIKVRKSK